MLCCFETKRAEKLSRRHADNIAKDTIEVGRAHDRDVGKFLRLFTDLPLEEIARLEALEGSEINAAKIALANEVTALCRGAEAASTAEATAAATFAGGVGSDLPVLDLPPEGLTVAAACTAIGFTASNGEAKRKIAEGALWLDEVPVTDPSALAQPGKLRLGKKKHGILRRA